MKSEFLFGHIVYIELDTFTIVGLDDNSQETITISMFMTWFMEWMYS